MDIWLIAYSDRHLQLFGTVLSGLEVGTPRILYLLCASMASAPGTVVSSSHLAKYLPSKELSGIGESLAT